MGLFSSRRRPPVPAVQVDWQAVVVDVGRSRCDTTTLGEPPRPVDFFSEPLLHRDVFQDEQHGLELGTGEAGLDYIVVDVARFPGRFKLDGRAIDLGLQTTESEIRALLGEPWWRDEDEDEVILFYEDGRVERQFELTKSGTLTVITLMLSPLMADREQRKAYGVTKPWPPGA
jgi:hypothetical protein